MRSFLKMSTFCGMASLFWSASSQAGSTSSAGVPNPISISCIEKLKGTEAIVEDILGNQYGICQIGDGYISTNSNPKTSQATTAFLESPEVSWPMGDIPDPALYYCAKIGGEGYVGYRFKWIPTEFGNFKKVFTPMSLCRFEDRSYIAASTLWEGPRIHAELANALRSN